MSAPPRRLRFPPSEATSRGELPLVVVRESTVMVELAWPFERQRAEIARQPDRTREDLEEPLLAAGYAALCLVDVAEVEQLRGADDRGERLPGGRLSAT